MISVRVTGSADLIAKLARAPDYLKDELSKAMGRSVAMAEAESKRRTPVLTGLLRSSIGGAQGYREVQPLRGELGTNVRYAVYVHEGHGKHKVGERKFMEKGLKSATPFIRKTIETALRAVITRIAR